MLGSIVDGIILGSIITLGGLGISYILLIQNYFNFTGGTFFTLGAYLAFAFLSIIPMGSFPIVSFGPGLILALILSMILLAIIMTVVDKFLYRPLRKRNSPFMFFYLTAFGMLFVLRSLIYLIWGPQLKNYISGVRKTYHLAGGINISPDEIFVVIATLIIVGIVYYFQYYTKLGKGMLATANDSRLAEISGIKNRNVHTTVTIIAGVLTATAGVFYGLAIQLRPIMGFTLLMAMFFAVVCGGDGAILGTFGAGLIIGITQEFGSKVLQVIFDSTGVPIEMGGYKQVLAFLLLIVILTTKPHGIFQGTFLER